MQSPWGRALHLASPPEQMSKCVSCASDTVIVENLLIHVISRVRVIISMTGLSIFSQILRLCRQALELQATHVEYQTLRLSRCCLRYTCVCAESDWMMCNNYSHAGVRKLPDIHLAMPLLRVLDLSENAFSFLPLQIWELQTLEVCETGVHNIHTNTRACKPTYMYVHT